MTIKFKIAAFKKMSRAHSLEVKKCLCFLGQCQCGQCTCHPPGDNRVHGKNCECDDRQCEDMSGEVCKGENKNTSVHKTVF